MKRPLMSSVWTDGPQVRRRGRTPGAADAATPGRHPDWETDSLAHVVDAWLTADLRAAGQCDP